jgi:hypothetical protein
LILEGDTEELFYPLIRDRFLKGVPVELRNIKGRGNVNKDVCCEIYKYAWNNTNEDFRAYCCVDSERHQRSATPLDIDFVRQQVVTRGINRALSVDAILADHDIESWFFHDIEGIYAFLGARKSQRNLTKYRNSSGLGKRQLQSLFMQFSKVYMPGKRAAHFIRALDIDRIVTRCSVLRQGIELIKTQAHNPENHLLQQ